MMRPNKVLNLAIATALSIGASSSYAGVLSLSTGTGSSSIPGEPDADPPKFASEYFLNRPDQKIPDGDTAAKSNEFQGDPTTGTVSGWGSNRFFYAKYVMEDARDREFVVTYSLSNGATFGETLSLSATDPDFRVNLTGTPVAATFYDTSSGQAGESSVSFLVQPTSTNRIEDKTLLLRFCLRDLDQSLATPGGKVDLTVGVYGFPPDLANPQDNRDSNHSPTATVATSTRGGSVTLNSATGTVEIDVSKGSVEFTGDLDDSTTPTLASLGTLKIEGSSSSAYKDTMDPWTFGFDTPQPTSAQLTIVDGNFAASLVDPGYVFLDVNNNKVFDSGTDIPAQVDSDDPGLALWDLTISDLQTIVNQPDAVPILILADGVTPINDYSEAPQATLVLHYGGDVRDTITSKLRHIKRNGTVCTIYNVPNPNAQDAGNIRITNTSATEAQLLGTLRLAGGNDSTLNGKDIFTNQPLLALNASRSTVSTVGPNETVRITADLLDSVTKNDEWLTAWQTNAQNPTGVAEGWPGRAILTISSDVQSMEVFGLVRNKSGGPLTNMSVGGTGNGCD